MNYNVVSRPKLPRNKYGEVEKAGGVSGTSYFSGSTESGGSSADVQIDTFKGSTASEDGIQGLVPAPKCNVNEPLGTLNDNKKFLKGTGAWVDIPISRYTTENPNKDGITLDGDLTVTDTLSTHTLNVTGAAHFWELVIDKVRSTSGNLLITPADFVVDYIGSDVTYDVDPTEPPFTSMFYYPSDQTGIIGLRELFTNQSVTQLKAKRLYQKNSDGTNQIVSDFEVGDMVRCKTLNLDEDNGFDNKDYWTFVLAVGTETYNSESCMYIDVLYQYTADGSTYGLGTTIIYDDTILPALEYHDNDLEIGIGDGYGTDKVFIASSNVSSGNCYLSIEDNDTGDYYEGNITWDGVKWNFDLTENSIYPNTTMNVGNSSDPLYNGLLECVQDSRFSNPIIKITDINGCSLDCFMYADGVFYITDKVSPSPALESFTFGYGTFNPAVGDNLVALGHLWDGNRQDAILIAACDPMDTSLTAPAIAQYRGIRTFESLSKYRTNTLAASGNEFTGRFLVDYQGNYIDINEKLNIFVADLTSGLEKVGIHLDGDSSTIRMVGSVEVRQNHDGTTDTFTVWDDDDKLRVQISPDEIPAKVNIPSSINPTYNSYFNSLNNRSIIPSSGEHGELIQHHTYTEFIWSWDHRWQYYTRNAYFDFITYDELGNYSSGDKISLDDFWANIDSIAYFKGSTRMTERGNNQQSISSVILRLQCNRGNGWATINTYNITNNASITIQSESASITYNNMLLNNYTLPYTGEYRIEMEIVYNVYASIVFTGKNGQQSNAYVAFSNNVRGGIKVISPSNAMTRIGANGILFNTSQTGQYFYSGNDGIEMKWGDVGVSLDQYGYRRYKKIYTVSNSGTRSSYYSYSIPTDADVIFVTGNFVRLVTNASNTIPEGKDLIVVGKSGGETISQTFYPYTTYASANLNSMPCTVHDPYSGEDGRDYDGTATSYRKHFIYHNSEWWEI
jgi:hypothetical protein